MGIMQKLIDKFLGRTELEPVAQSNGFPPEMGLGQFGEIVSPIIEPTSDQISESELDLPILSNGSIISSTMEPKREPSSGNVGAIYIEYLRAMFAPKRHDE